MRKTISVRTAVAFASPVAASGYPATGVSELPSGLRATPV